MTILKAIKDRIRTMGGSTSATNIADAIRDIPIPEVPTNVLLSSSTPDSTKKFQLKVVDNGTLTAEEVV